MRAGLFHASHGLVVGCLTRMWTRAGREVNTLQVWIDPARRDARRDPALRAYLALIGERYGILAMMRCSSKEAFLLLPPALRPRGNPDKPNYREVLLSAGVFVKLAEIFLPQPEFSIAG